MNNSKFVLRIPPRLHQALKKLAKDRVVSLNDICIMGLSEFSKDPNRSLIQTIQQAPLHTLSFQIEGIVLFGSIARGEDFENSDLDLLLVLPSEQKITRALYSEWDEKISDLLSPKITPHFVALPLVPSEAGSIWLEAALDGIVIQEFDQIITKLLSRLRRLIADGTVKRLKSHGSGYWIRNTTMEQNNA